MKKLILLLIIFSHYEVVYSQLPSPKKIDSLVKLIESKKDLVIKTVSDTFPTANPNVITIEFVKFYSLKNKLVKVAFAGYYHRKDSVMNNIIISNETYYFNNDLLIKVVSKDFDQSTPKDVQFYLNERDRKKYLAEQTINSGKFDGANYYIEMGYNLLAEFKQPGPKKAK